MKTVIIGAGVSGRGALRLTRALGIDAVMTGDDAVNAGEIGFAPDDTVIVSPGVRPDRSPLLRRALDSGARVISEMAYGAGHYPGKMLAITGTNGKTTTTELTGCILRACGFPEAAELGNIGTPVSEIAAEYIENGPGGAEVPPAAVEVSSFQLEFPGGFAPFAAVILNCASDHLDRHHNSMEEYLRTKYRIFDRVAPENRITMHGLPGGAAMRFTRRGDAIMFQGRECLQLTQLRIAGEHNAENLLAALELSSRIVAPERFFSHEFREAVAGFRTGGHRLELFAESDGVFFYDDSKATNPAAVVAAVNAVGRPVRLLAGGLDKDMDFGELSPVLGGIVKLYLIGEAADAVAAAAGNVPKAFFDTLEDAALAMCREAESGEAVLLSPACASMDMFRNYAERGDCFQRVCREFIDGRR